MAMIHDSYLEAYMAEQLKAEMAEVANLRRIAIEQMHRRRMEARRAQELAAALETQAATEQLPRSVRKALRQRGYVLRHDKKSGPY
jgi:hypothetical protein